MKAKSITYIPIMSVIIAVCAWLTVPSAVPFTMQTFGIFFALLFLGGKKGTFSILLYLLLGGLGLPVFSGFSGGLGQLFGPTGGYLLGFLLTGFIYTIFERFLGKSLKISIISLVLGLFLCYIFGTVWFFIYKGNMSFISAVLICVVPFIIPDLLKLALAVIAVKRIKKASV
ncbi:MAG: biotin transporter BioY [Clostridia bacterium]|nr:biotin transporter BioY [Clostridia bacterium]